MSLFPTSRNLDNFLPLAKPQQSSELKQEIEKFLRSAAEQPNPRRLCSRCGAEMEYVDTIFSLLGASSTWNIKIPTCSCSAADASCEQGDEV